MKKNKTNDVLFSDNIGELFFEGAKITLITMLVSILTMWLTSIFTNQILEIDMGMIVVFSTGISICFGTIKVYEMTMNKLK